MLARYATGVHEVTRGRRHSGAQSGCYVLLHALIYSMYAMVLALYEHERDMAVSNLRTA